MPQLSQGLPGPLPAWPAADMGSELGPPAGGVGFLGGGGNRVEVGQNNPSVEAAWEAEGGLLSVRHVDVQGLQGGRRA